MSNILWIIGAGASYHLGMPLLNGFPEFFQELWERFPENKKDAELAATLPHAIRILDAHRPKNVEMLLGSGSPLDDADKAILKRAIRRGFERRNLGRILKVFGKHGKLGPYCRLIGLMEAGDTVVSFNYDNALETPLCLTSKNFSALNMGELDSDQIAYLTDGRATNRWIPADMMAVLNERSLVYEPRSAFLGGDNIEIGNGRVRIPLVKIHGSVNWFEDHGSIHVGTPSDLRVAPLLIYPEAEKPELVQPPYSGVLQAAHEALSRCRFVVLIGYSFPPSDAAGHPFVSSLVACAPKKRMLAVDPFPKDKLIEVVGADRIFQATFEEVVQPDSSGNHQLGEEIVNLRAS